MAEPGADRGSTLPEASIEEGQSAWRFSIPGERTVTMRLISSHARYGFIAGLIVLLSVSASACDFATGPTSAVDNLGAQGSAGADVNQYLGNGDRNSSSHTDVRPTPSDQDTPEVDSLFLFGSGSLAPAASFHRPYLCKPWRRWPAST